ncbi:iron dependent repressor, metal binding and dimerization domain protein [Cellulosimicrobium arenosum]|uniref:Manganese transport regulator n=1 Tax=Cellulosimicrobium arenosum TaxID=2708133 RepID=A0A927PHJ3_9MICO|nr:metal-dependent transcriptional regulator [Cellulosimicrobium arenosum]
MDHPADLTPVGQDYLKVVWSAQEWSQDPVTTKLLAARMGVGASTVSETVRRLSAQGLLEHAPYGAIELTERGRALALAMVRRHRLLETYLVSELGYGWDEVHDEAEVLEHAVSDLMIERIDARLGHPTRDPHGDPIPTPSGELDSPPAVALSDLAAGEGAVVVRISDADPDVLRYLAELGVGLDTHVEVTERREYAGTVTLRWSGSSSAQLGLRAAEHVWVVRGSDPTA